METLRERALTKKERAELKRLRRLNEDELTNLQKERFRALNQKDKEMNRQKAKSFRDTMYPHGYLVVKMNGRPDTGVKYYHHVSPATSPRKSPKSPATSPRKSPTRRATSPHRSAHGGKRTRRSTRK